MKKGFLCLFFLFFVSICFGRANSKLDSLKRVLAKLPAEGKSFGSDTLRVNLYCNIGEEYRKKKNDSSFYFGKEALSLSQKSNYKKGKVKSYILIGNYYSLQSLSVKATENYLKALAIAEELKLNNEQILLTREIGSNYSSLHDFKQSYIYFIKHKDLCKKYGSNEDYVLSINNLGILFYDQKIYREALKYFLECEAWSEKTGNPKLINAALINVGKVYVELEKFDEALARYKRALNIEDGYRDKLAFVNNEIALIYFNKGEYSEALKCAKIALNSSTSLNQTMLKNTSQTISKIYERLGNNKEALKYFKLYTEISLKQDSIKNNQLVRFMNLDYQNEKQLFKIEGLNSEVKIKENQNKLLTISVIGVLLFLIIVLFFYYSIKNKNSFIEKQKAEISDLNQNLEYKINERTEELSEANKELIKKNFEITEALFTGQTLERKRVAAELHDNLGSTLSALKWRLGALNAEALSPKEKEIYDSIKSMMGTAYEEVRHISHNLLPVEFENHGLIGALQKLLNDINENGKIHFHVNVKGDFESLDNKIALELYSIILELVNNTLKHSNAKNAELLISYLGDKILFKLSDDGIGYTKSKDAGIGLKNIDERMKPFNGSYEIHQDKYWSFIFECKIDYLI